MSDMELFEAKLLIEELERELYDERIARREMEKFIDMCDFHICRGVAVVYTGPRPGSAVDA